MDLNRHFGDSCDIIKKSFLFWLRELGPWCAHPMFTHDIQKETADAFSRLLGVRLVSQERLLHISDRNAYLNVCRQGTHLFLDPDTGLGLGKGVDPAYLYIDELVHLARASPSFLTMTFDQSVPRGKEKAQVERKLEYLLSKGISGVAYVSHAAFILVSKTEALVAAARETIMRQSGLPAQRFACRLTSVAPEIGGRSEAGLMGRKPW